MNCPRPGFAPRARRSGFCTLRPQDRLLLALGLLMVLTLTANGAGLIWHGSQVAGSVEAWQWTELARVVAGVGLGTAAVMLPIVWLLVKRSFEPIHRLTAAARDVAAGKYRYVDIRRPDPLDALVESFNEMIRQIEHERQRADENASRLAESHRTLEQKVAERTGAIETASRRLASEIAEKEDFLRAISHDLNAPLRNIDGMVAMLMRKHAQELSPEAMHRLERIRQNVTHETELIHDLLELSRIKTRRDDPEPVNLEKLMWELRGIFENDLREKGIELIVETALPTLVAERARIRQVFQNLLDNAIKYMGEGERREIRVGCRRGLSEVEFYVSDTGRGIAPEDQEKVFYVFRRGMQNEGIEGKGVGLASVKSIVENYNGTIAVESEPGRGSKFRFTINGRFVQPGVGVTHGAEPRGHENGRAA